MVENLRARVGIGLAVLLGTAIVGVSSANAAVTSSHIATPSSPSFLQGNENNPMDPAHQITISGTTTKTARPETSPSSAPSNSPTGQRPPISSLRLQTTSP